MRGTGRMLAVASIAIFVTIGSLSAQAGVPAAGALEAYAQAQTETKPPLTVRVKTWTRAKLDAAKKRWAADKAKFEDCQQQLVELRKTKKLSLHKQGDFLNDCMNKKP